MELFHSSRRLVGPTIRKKRTRQGTKIMRPGSYARTPFFVYEMEEQLSVATKTHYTSIILDDECPLYCSLPYGSLPYGSTALDSLYLGPILPCFKFGTEEKMVNKTVKMLTERDSKNVNLKMKRNSDEFQTGVKRINR